MEKIPEWHIVYDEWAIHRATGRIRHIPCKRDCTNFNAFKRNGTATVVINKVGKRGKVISQHTVCVADRALQNRRETLMQEEGPHIHKCQWGDPYEEIEDVKIPTMVVEIALCYMKV